MVASIAERLAALKAERDSANIASGRELIVVKASVVDAEFERLGLQLTTVQGPGRMVSPAAYDAGDVAGSSLAINPALRKG